MTGKVRVEIFNELGAMVSSLNEFPINGELQMEAKEWPAGLYEVKVTAKGLNESYKLIKTR